MNKIVFAALLASLPVGPALALDTPSSSRYDHRIRYVTYNPADVVQVDTVLGVATHIMLEEGESYLTHAFGDSDAYAFAREGRHIFIKPQAELADTNLIVVTDRRSYKFRLSFKENRAGAIYELAFRYPDTKAKKAREEREKAKVEQAFLTAPAGYNLAYTMSGDLDLAPVNAWDNGRFTYFKFAANAELPAIYFVDADGNESLMPRTSAGGSNDIIMMHKINTKWMIRLGGRALAIFNEAFDPVGTPNTTGTASPAVRRMAKGNK